MQLVFLFYVPFAVGVGYAIGYGLGPYLTYLQHTLRGVGYVALLLAIVLIIVVVRVSRAPRD